MGNQASVSSFAADDAFLRHVHKRSLIKDDLVHAEAFEDEHETLSFTLRAESLLSDEGIDQYHHDKALPSGDLPGLCQLYHRDFVDGVRPPLPPRHDPVPEDEKYGHLHCCTDRPIDRAHREQLAKLATRNRVLREFVRHRKLR